ncbi:hypothetical protein ACFYZB_45570 [Streptomyces sp. NPDC001852]|uniref:hypothetical protein n=1 Tax=Streptomyces sp. NPDC001852 TaxID=3364619 RepID=UPI00369DBD69
MTTVETRALVDIPDDLLPRILLPPLEVLPDARARGAECVWGGEPLSTATAVDLGERETDSGHWFPRACRPCTRRVVLAARNDHSGRCEQCTDDATICETRRALHVLVLELRR